MVLQTRKIDKALIFLSLCVWGEEFALGCDLIMDTENLEAVRLHVLI